MTKQRAKLITILLDIALAVTMCWTIRMAWWEITAFALLGFCIGLWQGVSRWK